MLYGTGRRKTKKRSGRYVPEAENFRLHLPVSGKSYNVRKKTVLDVFQISFRYVQTLQTKMRFNLDISDKKGTHHNRPCAVSFDVKELGSEFKLRFGPPRSDPRSYCNEFYIHPVAAETEDEQKSISAQSTLHHRTAETAYKVLHKVVAMSKSNPKYVLLCTVSGHSFLPCERDFALIERRKMKSTVYHPKQWLEVIVNAILAFSAYYMDKEGFIDLSVIEGMFKKQPDFKITSFHWIHFSSEEPNTVLTRVSLNTLQTWHSYVIRSLPKGREHLRLLQTVLSQLYEEAIAIKKEKKNTC
ncbi:hypothetical protein PR048_009092 [Dryococelus australis]|uniref:Uncharacterized protein n=1 Tax=Dryococelus australis TaxID=614101 RepID=A0ABQ9HYX4_9NEOP|nr:hypothetical protein PR048_009092 [Dryococelus australis]